MDSALMLRNTGMRPRAITRWHPMEKDVMRGTMTAAPTGKAAAMIAAHPDTTTIIDSYFAHVLNRKRNVSKPFVEWLAYFGHACMRVQRIGPTLFHIRQVGLFDAG